MQAEKYKWGAFRTIKWIGLKVSLEERAKA